jgi:uncharacterized protein YegP (UPF0339 family)
MADIAHPYFQVYKDVKGQWRWRLQARNHKIIGDSSEGYVTRQSCLDGIALVKGSTAIWDSEAQKWL